MFIHHKGDTKTVYFPRAASTEYSVGEALAFDGSGNVIPAVAGSTEVIGVCHEEVSSGDDDYAESGVSIAVKTPIDDHTEWLADTAAAVAADVGKDVDLTDSETVNRGASATGVVRILGVISPTKVRVEIN